MKEVGLLRPVLLDRAVICICFILQLRLAYKGGFKEELRHGVSYCHNVNTWQPLAFRDESSTHLWHRSCTVVLVLRRGGCCESHETRTQPTTLCNVAPTKSHTANHVIHKYLIRMSITQQLSLERPEACSGTPTAVPQDTAMLKAARPVDGCRTKQVAYLTATPLCRQ